MLRSILSLVSRQFFRNLYFSSLTLGSLVIGIAVVIFEVLWDRYEFGYNKLPDAERVFVVMNNELYDGKIETRESFNIPMDDYLTRSLPEVESMTRIDNTRQQLMTSHGVALRKVGIYGDTAFFKIFETPPVEGSMEHPFANNRSIAISDKMAAQLFKNSDALGQFVTLDGKREFQVSLVYKTYPEDCDLNYVHFVLPFHAIQRQPDEWVNYYVKLRAGASKEAVEKKIDAYLLTLVPDGSSTAFMFSVPNWRLHWNFENGKSVGGRIRYLIIFNVTAAFILLMACINYINLATARASRRAREIGVRKVTGATQGVLVGQFLAESVVLSMIATGVALVIVLLLLPVIRSFIGVPLTWHWEDPAWWIGLPMIGLVTGLMAGAYPSFLLSSLRPALILKGNIYTALSGATMRRTLVSVQFALSIGMFFVAFMMWRQTDFLLKRDVGYDKHNVINVWLPTDVMRPQEALKTELARHPSVKAVAFSGASPMEINGSSEVEWLGKAPGEEVFFYGATIGGDMIPMLGLKMLQGRNFAKDRPADSSNFVINRRAAELMGMEDPVGQQITYSMFGKRKGEIIGVVDDFNNDDIHLPMAPVVFILGNDKQLFNLFIRYEEGQLDAALANLKDVFNRLYPGITYDYSFLDQDFEAQMLREINLGKISMALTVMAVLIAMLGLLGLTMFSVERRTKEVGIRKVLGASVPQVMGLFFREFVIPGLVALVIAFPLANYILQQFLRRFPYQVPVTAVSFLSVAVGAGMVIGLVVSVHTYKAAKSNPVEALKHE